MWTAVVVFVGSFVCLLMLIFSIAVGFSFFVVPILIAELMFLAAVYLMRRAFAANRVVREPRRSWYAGPVSSPPQAMERRDERPAHSYRAGSRR